MQAESTTAVSSPAIKDGVLVLDGYGLRVTVKRKHLLVSDGIGRTRHWGRFAKATAGIKRLVVLGHSGIVSLDALRWLRDIGAGFIQIDRNGEVVAASCPIGTDDARLRRAQALAPHSPLSMEIARYLIREKLHGELAVLSRLPDADAARHQVQAALNNLEKSTPLDEIRVIEAQAAIAYWSAWGHVPITFATKDLERIPDHWRTFGSRGSPLTGSPRLATNPINSIFNYLFAMAEAETRLAMLTVGLDPGMGILHADQWGRDSMALDIIEAVRHEVDEFVLELLKKRCFRAADFHESVRGQCRVLPPLTHTLAETSPIWERRIAPVVEEITRVLASSNPRIVRITTPLTESNRSAGRISFRRLSSSTKSASKPSVAGTCQMCGGDLPSQSRMYCDECVKKVRNEKLPRLLAAGASIIARLAAEGLDPAHGGEAARKRGKSNARRMREAAEWDQHHGKRPDPEQFMREVLPRLQGIPLRRMMRTTGLSLRYCSLIRRGLYVPHPRHWESLKGIGIRPGLPSRRSPADEAS
jgi:CRISPR-associated endonuclease Cas1